MLCLAEECVRRVREVRGVRGVMESEVRERSEVLLVLVDLKGAPAPT